MRDFCRSIGRGVARFALLPVRIAARAIACYHRERTEAHRISHEDTDGG